MRKMSDIVRDQSPLMLPPDATVMQAARHMRDRRVGAVLVTEGDCELVGIFIGRDAVSRVLAEGKDPAATTLSQVMTYNPDTMTPSHSAIEALRLMQDARCRHLPILHDGQSGRDCLARRFQWHRTGPARRGDRPWERIA
jgi:signal-transduction protein with cAMP-binding, CBS, and nucleotidyltransferase domain